MHVDGLFFFCKQIEEQRANACFANGARYKLIAWAVTATARTVGEQDHTLCASGNAEVALKDYFPRTNLDIARSSGCGLCPMIHGYPRSLDPDLFSNHATGNPITEFLV